MHIKHLSPIYLSLLALFLNACAGNPQQLPPPPSNKPIAAVPLSTASQKRSYYFAQSFQPQYLQNLATQAASLHGIDKGLFHALITQESAWDPNAISHKGARGLTQIMPQTGRLECGLAHDVLLDPKLNLHCGAYYFSKLLRRFRNVELALAAYNSGETRVARLGRVPRIRETQHYVKRIMRDWQNN